MFTLRADTGTPVPIGLAFPSPCSPPTLRHHPAYLRPKGELITGDIFALIAFFRHRDRPNNSTAAPIAGHGMTQSQLDEAVGLVLGHAITKFGIAQTVDEGRAGPADGPGHLDAGSAEGDVVCIRWCIEICRFEVEKDENLVSGGSHVSGRISKPTQHVLQYNKKYIISDITYKHSHHPQDPSHRQ